MSTRSIIVVHGQDLYEKNRVTRLYKHSDGYPTGALEVIQSAIETAQRHVYTPSCGDDKEPRINVSTMVGMVIGAGTSEYGMGVVQDTEWANESEKPADFSEPFDAKKHLGNQSDLEWVYVIDLNKKTVSILGGGYTGKKPGTFKLADPFAYAKCLYEQYRAETIAETDKLIRYIEAWGFKVLCKRTPKRAIKTAAKMADKEEL